MHVCLQQASEETTSPDFSTSSLISCSEHYNGDSLLDPGQMSPHSPSSPDTPEWSLIANGDSFHKVRLCYNVVIARLCPLSRAWAVHCACCGQLTLASYTTGASDSNIPHTASREHLGLF